jgi:hypothetical protein
MADEETESDSDSEEETSGAFQFTEGAGWVERPKKVSPAVNGGLPDYLADEYDKSYWDCKTLGKTGAFVR